MLGALMERPVRILVVDDDAPTRRLLSAALASEGLYEVITARDAGEAQTFYESSPGFDMIITDLNMPSVSGLDLIQNIRALGSAIPILILTSQQTDATIARALEIGADDYLQKPVDLRELRSAVAYSIDKHRSRQDAEEAAQKLDALSPAFVDIPENRPAVRTIDDGTFVEFTTLNDPAVTERFQRFAERILGGSLSVKERGELRLALEEIVRNAIEWGNKNDPTKMLRLSYCLLLDRITFRVEDEGKGFDPASLKDPSLDPRAHIQERRASGKRMGGWGIFLARKMVDEVTFNRKGNVVFLTKYLVRHSQTDRTEARIDLPSPPTSGEPATVGAGNGNGNGSGSVNPNRRSTRMLRKTTRLLRKEDPRFKEA
jgi:CheY-like chemotaxis protein